MLRTTKIQRRQHDIINGSTEAYHQQSTSGVTLVTEEMKKLSLKKMLDFFTSKVTVVERVFRDLDNRYEADWMMMI